MTAEIAILNKTAIALAADSAVTLSAGSNQQKIFDSEDKLFELCDYNHIGVMINNTMSFAETPIGVLVRRFRNEGRTFKNVTQAAYAFLQYLHAFGAASPQEVQDRGVTAILEQTAQQMSDRVFKKLRDRFSRPDFKAEYIIQNQIEDLDDVIAVHERVLAGRDNAEFINSPDNNLSEHMVSLIPPLVKARFAFATDEQRGRLEKLLLQYLLKNIMSDGRTGIIVAGFGSEELFPTLVAFEIDGMVGGSLKYIVTDVVDIDRTGTKARVLPFAQKEMVDRFLYGIDDATERLTSQFCSATIGSIREGILEKVSFPSAEDRAAVERIAADAEQAFLSGLRERAFESIRSKSRVDIEDMVEFMPKPELAKMAEALVNLTSIKRRVTRGMETVGGPIDVAVISQSEGFVWIKRKHYFTPELNGRYETRRLAASSTRELTNGQDAKAGTSRPTRRRSGGKRKSESSKVPS